MRARLNQEVAQGTRLLGEAFGPGEDALTAEPGLADNTIEGLVLVRGDLVFEVHFGRGHLDGS